MNGRIRVLFVTKPSGLNPILTDTELLINKEAKSSNFFAGIQIVTSEGHPGSNTSGHI